jgi:branched-chain amino acid transport system substrate-binding protein
VLVALASCSGGGDGAVPTTSAVPSEDTNPIVRRNVDGVFRIGVWLPQSGPAAALGSPLAAGVELAVQEINEAGGVNGHMVDVTTRDEGSDPATAYQGLRQLLEDDQVDAILGPASSRVALGALDTLAAAHAVACSPTSSAVDLNGARDNGFFVRTIGSEALEAVALTRAMIATGRTAFSVLYPDDDYGLGFANQVQRAFRRLREGVRLIPYDPTAEHFNAPAEQALSEEIGAIAVVGTGQTGADVLGALEENDLDPTQTPVFVTGGLRTDDLGTMIDPRRPAASAGIQGVSPMASPFLSSFEAAFAVSSPGTPVAYAAYAYDCVNLLALAAVAAGTDDGDAVQAQLAAVSSGGSRCEGFAACATQLRAARNIDLEGASGDLDLQDDGDVATAWYDLFVYDAGGNAVTRRTVLAQTDAA